MPSLYLDADRRAFFADKDGRWSAYKDEDSVLSYTIDWSRVLGSDTISTSTWAVDAGDVTASSSSNTTTTTTTTVSNTDGVLKNTIVTAGGLTHVRRIAFKAKEL